MTQEEKIALYVKNNPNCSWEDVNFKYSSICRKEVFLVAKNEVEKIKISQILEKLVSIFDENENWSSFEMFFSFCVEKGIPKIQKSTINRFFHRAQNVRKIIHSK